MPRRGDAGKDQRRSAVGRSPLVEPISASAAMREALPALKLALAGLSNAASLLAKSHFQRWKNEGNIRKLATRILDITRVKTLYGSDEPESLYRFYFPSKVRFNEQVTKPVNSLQELGPHRYVIEGTAGQGKSIFLRFLTGQELRQATSSGRIPVFVELRRVQSSVPLKSLVYEAFVRLGLEVSDSLFDSYARSGRIVLLLDAFDEIESSVASEALGYLETLATTYQSLQIVVTARPDSDIQRSNSFRVVRLAPLTSADHAGFLKKICPSGEDAERLESAIKQSSVEIRGLLTTPLLLTLLTVIYSAQQSIPDTLPGFYEQLFDVLFFKHDRAKATFKRKRYTKLDDTAIRKLFEAFCFQVRIEGKGVLGPDLFRECVQRAASSTGVDVDPSAFRSEMVKTVCLMQEEGVGELVFVHKSVAEFHAAAFVRHSTDDIAARFYETLRSNQRWNGWRQELRFLQEIDPVRFARYFATPELTALRDKLAIARNTSGKASGQLMKYPLDQIGVLLVATGETTNTGWSRPVSATSGLHEDSYFSSWLREIAIESDKILKANPELAGVLRRGGRQGARLQGEDAPRVFVSLERLSEAPVLRDLIQRAFDNFVAQEVLNSLEKCEQLVKREQEKLAFMTILAKKPIEY